MAEVLKRWNGTEWVTVSSVNRIEIGSSSEFTGVLDHPKYRVSQLTPFSKVPTINATNGLNVNYYYTIE